MAAASSLSFAAAHVAPPAPQYNSISCMVAGRRYELPAHNPCRPVADMQAKGRKRSAGARRQKWAGSKSQGITEDIREPSISAPEETVSASTEQQGPSEHLQGSVLLEKPLSTDGSLPKDEIHMESSALGAQASTNGVSKDVEIEPTIDARVPTAKEPCVGAEDGVHAKGSTELEQSILAADSTIGAAQDLLFAEDSSTETTQDTLIVAAMSAHDSTPAEITNVSTAWSEGVAAQEEWAPSEDNRPELETQTQLQVGAEDGVHAKGSTELEQSILAADSTIEAARDLLVAEDSSTETTQDTLIVAAMSAHDSTPAEITNVSMARSEEVAAPEEWAASEDNRPELETQTQLQVENKQLSIRTLSEKAALGGRKIFSFPECPKAGMEVEVFLNRSASTLSQRPSVRVRGAYNNWRWRPFEADLAKSNLPGDWWACKLEVPEEAFKIDFVFHDGGGLYENNSNQDFSLPVEDGMQEAAFEDFLIEEERREAERIATEKAMEEKRLEEERRQAEKQAAEEADRREAIKRVNEEREKASRVLQRAVKHVKGLWYFEPPEFEGGDAVKLFYNRAGRNLATANEVWIHGGHNNWQDMVSIVGQLTFYSNDGGDWWTTNVVVPKQAFVLNWVFADGPPESATLYDNNAYQDFHALVPRGVPNELYWRELEERIYNLLQKERDAKEEAAHKKTQRTSEIKAEFKAKTRSILIKSRKHILYTEPVDVLAGQNVTIFYNPTNTVLHGKSPVWLRASFNRWTHRLGCLPPIQMLPVENSPFVKGTLKVPLDAYMMDFVFSERGNESEGIFDNNHGKDYHVEVVGGTAKEPPMKVVHISVEMAPIAKVGGLGDVVTSLSRAVQELGHSIEVVLPKYDCLKYGLIDNLHEKEDFFWANIRIKVWNGMVEGLPVIFLEPENGMFWAGCVYGRRDDGQRFGFFCHAALEYLLRSGRRPDIIHCHDWSSAPVAWLFQEQYKQSNLANARVVFTIHNLEFGTALIGRAMAFADRATTVSETYAAEVSRNPAIAPHLYKFCGIRNGIDLDIWDPYNDPFIPVPYSSQDVMEGKKAAKQELQSRLGLAQADRPLVGIITRLTAQKGIHLIKHAIGKTLERGGQVVLLGSAPDPRIQNDFGNLANQLHSSRGDMARLCLYYDEPLSHLIYAGSDFILIPSMFEPCGLTQLIAMRYGAIPVVRRTGGLNDTVFDVDHDAERAAYHGLEANGFSFEGADAPGIDYALNRAISAWYDARDWFYDLSKQVMEQDWSWNRPALDYMELYYNARK